MKNIKKNHAQWALANFCAGIAATATFWGSLALLVGGVGSIVTLVLFRFSNEIATNTWKTALYLFFAVIAFLIWWWGAIISEIVFDFIRRQFGFPEFSRFRNKVIYLPFLWSVISLVGILCYSEFRIAIDPEFAQRSAIIAEQFEQKTLSRESLPLPPLAPQLKATGIVTNSYVGRPFTTNH